jgi:hypothetical protein
VVAFGTLQAGLDIEYSRSSVSFTWEGFDEMDQVSGDGSAELLNDGSIQIEIRLSQCRRSRPQSQTGHFFNSLLEGRDAREKATQEPFGLISLAASRGFALRRGRPCSREADSHHRPRQQGKDIRAFGDVARALRLAAVSDGELNAL